VRGFRSGVTPVRAGLIAAVVIAIGTYFAFAKDIPFTHTYRVQAVFENSNLLAKRSPVRIAGIDVGKVVKVDRYKDTDMALVTMEIKDEGRPVHRDATMKIRPRLFLEGNFYVDLKPGTPQAPEIPEGGMIGVSQTSAPVQLDQVLTALQSDTRVSLQKTLKGLGEGFGTPATPADDADQDPSVAGLTGGQALNQALVYSPAALRDSALVLQSLQGNEPHGLSRTIKGISKLSAGLSQDENALRDLIVDFNATTGMLAAHGPQLEQAVRLLGPTATNLRRGLGSIDRALPATRGFARDILPGILETPATIAAAQPWLPQAKALLGPNELGGLLKDLQPATAELANLAHQSRRFLPTVDDFNRCVNEVLLPTSDIKVEDGDFSVDAEVYKELWYSMVGAAGEGQFSDGNGSYLRVSGAGGGTTVKSGPTTYFDEQQFSNFTSPPQRTRPAFPGIVPPLRRDVPCYRNPVPDVNGPASVGPADGSRPDAPNPPEPPQGSVLVTASPSQVAAQGGPALVPLKQISTGGQP
jgi:phospholipid/cholesterol/gamma-HCH transport system substrate-binding protein